jgi:hypothetical protein
VYRRVDTHLRVIVFINIDIRVFYQILYISISANGFDLSVSISKSFGRYIGILMLLDIPNTLYSLGICPFLPLVRRKRNYVTVTILPRDKEDCGGLRRIIWLVLWQPDVVIGGKTFAEPPGYYIHNQSARSPSFQKKKKKM